MKKINILIFFQLFIVCSTTLCSQNQFRRVKGRGYDLFVKLSSDTDIKDDFRLIYLYNPQDEFLPSKNMNEYELEKLANSSFQFQMDINTVEMNEILLDYVFNIFGEKILKKYIRKNNRTMILLISLDENGDIINTGMMIKKSLLKKIGYEKINVILYNIKKQFFYPQWKDYNILYSKKMTYSILVFNKYINSYLNHEPIHLISNSEFE